MSAGADFCVCYGVENPLFFLIFANNISFAEGVHDKDKSTYRRTVKYLGLFGGSLGLSKVFDVVRNKFASVLLGVSGQSVIAIANRTVQMFSECTNLSLSFSAVRRLSDAYENSDERTLKQCIKVVRSMAFFTGLLGVVLMLALMPLISMWIFDDAHGYYMPRFMLMSPVLFFMAVANGELAILRGVKRLNKVAAYTLLSSFLSLLVSVPLYLLLGLGGVFLVILLTAFLQMCVLLYFSLPLYRYEVSPFSMRLLREGIDIVKFGAGYIFASILSSLAMWLIIALLSNIGDGETAGLFSAGFMMMTMLPGILFAALDSEYYPRLSGVASDTEVRNGMVNEQVEVQVLVQSPLLMMAVVAMPVLIPLFYKADFMPAVVMAQLAMFGMLMRTMTYPISFLPLVKGDTTLFLILETLFNAMLVGFVSLGFWLYGLSGVGVALALVHTADFFMVYTVSRYRYGMRLSGEAVRCMSVQMPLFVMTVAVAVLCSGVLYWLLSAVCVCVSLALTFHILNRRQALPEALERVVARMIKLFKR